MYIVYQQHVPTYCICSLFQKYVCRLIAWRSLIIAVAMLFLIGILSFYQWNYALAVNYVEFVDASVNEESAEFEGLWCLFNLCVGTAVGNEISTQWWPENNTKIYKNAYFDYFCNKIEFSKSSYLVPLGLRNLQN